MYTISRRATMDNQTIATRQLQLASIHSSIQALENQFQCTLASLGWTTASLQTDHEEIASSNKPQIRKKYPTINETDTIIDLRTSEQKLNDYNRALEQNGHFTEPELQIPQWDNDGGGGETGSSNRHSGKSSMTTFAEITNKLKRDIKRRRMKYRVTKTPPQSYTEEIRALIGLQMDSWQRFIGNDGGSATNLQSNNK